MSKRLIVAASALALLLLHPGPAASEDWPMFHHDLALSGYTTGHAPDDNALLWAFNTDAIVNASPVIVDGVVYIGDRGGVFWALDASTGAVIWSYDTNSSIHSTAAVAQGNAYFLCDDGTMYALDTASGAVVWSVVGLNGPWSWSSPAFHDGNVFVAASNGSVYCFDAMTGSTHWVTAVGGSPDGPIAVAHGKVFSGTHNFDASSPTLVALDELSGAIVWTYDYHLYHGGVVGMVNSNGPAVVDGDGDGALDVYFGVYNWGGVSDQAVCLNEADGTEKWSAPLGGNSTSSPAVHGGKVFIGSDNGKIFALDAATGAFVWSYPTAGQVWSAPAVADGKVFAGSLDHTMYAVDETSGALVWSYFTGASRMLGSPAVANGTVYVGNENGNVYAFGSNQPPDCSQASVDVELLWPPNHKLVPVHVAGVTDPDGDPVVITITGVTQDEPLDGLGDGDTCPDARLTAGLLELRAERSGLGNGRVYAISFTAEDDRGGSCEGVLAVCVPHDQRPGSACVDDGQSVNSLGTCNGNTARDAGSSFKVQFARGQSHAATIEYSLPRDSEVRLGIFDVAGRAVTELINSHQTAGFHQVTWSAAGLPSGVYYAHMRARDYVVSKSIVFLK